MKTKLENLKEYTIENDYLKVSFLNYGGSITGVYLKKSHPTKNLVIAYQDKKDYFEDDFTFLNALVGPVAGRLEDASFVIDGKEYNITANDGVNNIHGGNTTTATQFFDVEQTADEAVLTLNMNHKEDGFVGDFAYKVVYKLEKDRLIIDFLVTPSEKTTLNMTSHMYFNLSGNMETSIEDHILQIDSSKKLRLREDNCPVEVVKISEDDAYDFKVAKPIRDLLESDNEEVKKALGLDVPYIIDGKIILKDLNTNISLTIESSVDAAVFYTSNYFGDNLSLNEGRKGYPYSSVAIELLEMPNGINIVKDDTYVYGPNRPYTQNTVYTFKSEWFNSLKLF